MRGNIRTWLERNNESERAEELYSLIEDVDDLNEKVFKFVHFYGKSLPFIYMGKIINFENLHLYLWKNILQKEISKAEAAIIERLYKGKIASLLDYYLKHNETNNELDILKEITSNLKGETPESIHNYFDIIINRNNYFLPFLNSQSSLNDAVKTISIIKSPMTLERWNELYQDYTVPMKELRSADTYISALEQIEKLKEDKLLFKANNLSDSRREELKNCDIESYTEQSYIELWGYDDDTVSLLNSLFLEYKSRYFESVDRYKKMNFEVTAKYIKSLNRRTEMITDGEKVLLKFMREYPASFGSAYFAVNKINEISPAGDNILQAKIEYMKNIAKESEEISAEEVPSDWKFIFGIVILIILFLLFITRH
jgi:hypothetical protein